MARAVTDTALRQHDLPIRTGVGILLLNRRNRVFIGRRSPRWSPDDHFWHMPQGGVEKGERHQEAVWRELAEETGLTDCEIIATMPGWVRYDLPEELLGIALKGRYRGQRMRWYALRFTGGDDEIDLNPRGRLRAEFDDWRWERPERIPGLTIPYKRLLYEEVIAHFSSAIDWPTLRS
jgi:putative (di)nucleoside polyphosphate hydrolase